MSYKRSVITYFVSLLILLSVILFAGKSAGSSPHLRRICISSTGVVTINWYNYTDTCQGFEKVLIYGEQHFGSFSLVDSSKVRNATSIAIPNAAKFLGGLFFIEYISKCGPNPVISDTMQVDSTPPPVTDPDSVSVLANGTVVIGWSTNPPGLYKDTKSFIINSVKGGSFPLDTIYRNKATFGTDTTAKPDNGPVSYQLAAVDSCDNVSPLGNAHSTIFLSASQDSCKYTVTLSWTPYIGWRKGVAFYDIYYSLDSSKGYTYFGNTAVNSFTFTGLTNFTKYYFFVRGVEESLTVITSSSNRISLTTSFEKDFKYVYIKTVSAVGNDLQIAWTTSNNPEVGYFEVYRGIDPASLVKIATVSGINVPGGEYSYVDGSVDASEKLWYYMVKVYNSCGHYSGSSNVPHNIILKLLKDGNVKNLSWNPYEKWNGGVLKYSILRTVEDANPVVTDIGDVNAPVLAFTDLDSFSNYGRPGVCYQLKAYEDGDSDMYGFSEVSYSNMVCYIDAPIVYIPNAFAPYEDNNIIFKPVVSFADTTQSELDIYNRWGQLIFKSNSIWKGWDGKNNKGQMAPNDVYVYYITVTGLDLTVHRYKGTVSLL